MSSTNPNNSMSAFDLEPNPFEQSFASTKEQQTGNSSNSSNIHQNPSYLSQESQPLQPRPEAKASLGVRRSSDVKSPFMYTSQKPNVLSPPLLTPGGFRRLPPLLLSPSCVPSQNPGPINHNGNNNSGMAVNNGNNDNSTIGDETTSNASISIKQELTRTPSFFLNLSKTGLTPNESSLRTGLTPGIIAAGQQQHPYPTLPALNGTSQGHPQMKSSSVTNGGVTSAPFTPGLGSVLGFTGNTNQTGRSHVNPENSYGTAGTSVAGADSSTTNLTRETNNEQISQTHLQQHQYSHQQQQQQQQQPKRSSPQSDSSQIQQQLFPTGRKRNPNNSNKGPKSIKKSQSSTPNSLETRRISRNEDTRSLIDDNKDISEDEQGRKRKEFLERNRVAASKFRRRKKEYIKRVEMDLQFYENEYEDMGKALDKLCGIIPGSPTPATSSSLISLLENSISCNDLPSSLSILAHMKQIVYETRYFQRNGRNPRREMENHHIHETDDDEDRHKGDSDSMGNIRSRNGSTTGPIELSQASRRSSSINYSTSVPAHLTDTTLHYQQQQQQRQHSAPMTASLPNFSAENEGTASSILPVSLIYSKQSPSEQEASGTIGTIGSVPDVMNARHMTTLNNFHDTQRTSHHDNMPYVRHSSLVDLANQSMRAEPMLPKYPNTG